MNGSYSYLTQSAPRPHSRTKTQWSVETSGIVALSFAGFALIAMIVTQVVTINVRDTNTSALIILGVEWVLALFWGAGIILSSRSVMDYSKDTCAVIGVAVSVLQPIVGSAIPYFDSFIQMGEMLRQYG